MHGFCVMIDRQKRKIDEKIADTVFHGMQQWGSNASTWHPAPFIFAHARAHHLISWDQIWAKQENWYCIGYFRLGLSLSKQLQQELSNEANWVLNQYMRFGKQCCEKIPGQWAFVIYNHQTHETFFAISAGGNVNLCYATVDNQLIITTSHHAILAHPGHQKVIHEKAIAGILLSYFDLAGHQGTCYQNIHRLHQGELGLDNGQQISTSAWWQPTTKTRHISIRERQKSFDIFADLWEDVVKDHCDTDQPVIATTLSSGLDSTSVTMAAAKHASSSGKNLVCYTHVPIKNEYGENFTPDRKTRTYDEWLLARQTAESIQAQQHIPIAAQLDDQGEPIFPITNTIMQHVKLHASPAHAASNLFWIDALLKKAQSNKHQLLLTGQRGNASISYESRLNFFNLMQETNLLSACQVLSNNHQSWYSTIRNHVVKPIWYSARHAKWTYLEQITPADWQSYSLINPAWALDLRISDQLKAMQHDPQYRPWNQNNRHHYNWRLGLFSVAENSAAKWMELGGAYGIDIHDPTSDRRIVEFCSSLPSHMFWEQGMKRALVRQGLRHLIPPHILDAPRKGVQAGDITFHIQREQSVIFNAIHAFEKHELCRRCLDLTEMKHVLHKIIHGNLEWQVDSVKLLRALSVGYFLRQH